MAEDDAIMKTRLLIDGDGMGDDRKINTLIRQIVKFASANADETPEDVRHVDYFFQIWRKLFSQRL